MQSVISLFRLGLGGLFLEPQAYREQRDSPDGLRRGFVLVALFGLLVGLAALLGDLIEYLAQPRTETIIKTVYDGLRVMPWYSDLAEISPGFPAQFDRIFDQIQRTITLASGGGLFGSLAGLLTTPLLHVLGWLIFGTVAHLMARAFGGTGSFSQTLACTALAAGTNMLGLVQIIPFAQWTGTAILGLLACYVAIREAHQLPPWRAFWATIIGPLVLGLLLIGIFCVGLVVFIQAIDAFLNRGGGL